jgi:hypothetical protein
MLTFMKYVVHLYFLLSMSSYDRLLFPYALDSDPDSDSLPSFLDHLDHRNRFHQPPCTSSELNTQVRSRDSILPSQKRE